MNEQTIAYMSIMDLLNSENVYAVQSEPEEVREHLKAVYLARMTELKADEDLKKQVIKMFKAYDKADKCLAEAYTREYAQKNSDIPLKHDSKGNPVTTIENFLMILRNDKYFSSIKYNELSYRYEHLVKGKYEEWKNVDDSKAREYIETKYHIHHKDKCDDAMRIAFDEHKYHPVKEIIEAVKWDGTPRLQELFIKWLKCEDSAYTREVTRLVFAGGIHRIYNPGCKFDDVCVLVGTQQGEGKSSFVRWLALEDRFFGEIKNIESKDDKQVWQGKWVCELVELMAVTSAKEVENVKAFITTQTDRYRMPYEKRTEDFPRQCVFVGTTNKSQFLIDKTGNRRWYPLKVHSSGYDLFDHKDEIQKDIIQCWAEAKAMYDKGELSSYASRELMSTIREKQSKAVEDDYRVGLIKKYLEGKERVCIFEIWKNALDNPTTKPTRRDSNDISLILQTFPEWERSEKSERSLEYGVQTFWHNTKPTIEIDEPPEFDDDFDF